MLKPSQPATLLHTFSTTKSCKNIWLEVSSTIPHGMQLGGYSSLIKFYIARFLLVGYSTSRRSCRENASTFLGSPAFPYVTKDILLPYGQAAIRHHQFFQYTMHRLNRKHSGLFRFPHALSFCFSFSYVVI